MDYIARIVAIRTTLENRGYSDIAINIYNAQMEMGTPGEMFTKVCFMLRKLKNNKEVYKLIRDDADWLLNYAKEIGY